MLEGWRSWVCAGLTMRRTKPRARGGHAACGGVPGETKNVRNDMMMRTFGKGESSLQHNVGIDGT